MIGKLMYLLLFSRMSNTLICDGWKKNVKPNGKWAETQNKQPKN